MEIVRRYHVPKFVTFPVSKNWMTLIILLSLLVYVDRAAVTGIWSLWKTSAFSHGFLIVPISVYLIWMRRGQLRTIDSAPTFWALPVLILVEFVWLLAHLSLTAVVEQFCFVTTGIVIVWGLFGTEVLRTIRWPLAFLFFAVPVGEVFVPKLQDFCAWFAMQMLDLAGIPVLREGRFIFVPFGEWEVAEACSGIRYLTASLAVGFLFAGSVYRTWSRRIAFFAASAVVPILANAVRVFGIILLAYVSGNRIAVGVDHILYGWLFFTIVMALLLLIGGRWRETRNEAVSEQEAVADLSISTRKPNSGAPQRHMVLFTSAGILILLLGPLSVMMICKPGAVRRQSHLLEPTVLLPLHRTSEDVIPWKPEVLAPTAELAASYEAPRETVKLYLAYYAAECGVAKFPSSTSKLFDRNIWSRIGEEQLIGTIDGQAVSIHQTRVRSAQTSLVIWDWYWVDGRFTSNPLLTRLLLLKARILRAWQGATLIVVATEERVGQPSAALVLQDFLDHVSLHETLLSGE